MARFSEGFLRGISDFGRMDPTQPARRLQQATPSVYQQMGTTDPLARRVGSLFSNLGVDTSYMQTAPERIAAETKGLDLSTIEGQQQAIQAELQYIQDPQARRALGMRLMELNKLKLQQEELALKKQQELSQQTAIEQVALSLEEYKDTKTAELMRTGAITPQQGNARRLELQKSAAASANGKSGQLARLRGLGLQDSELFRQVEAGQYEGVSDTQFASIVSDLEESIKVEQQIDFLKKEGREDLVEQLEMGMITSLEAGNKLREPPSTTQYANRKQMLKGDSIVWVADVKPKNEDEYVGAWNPETKKWEAVEAEEIKELPKDVSEKISDISYSDLSIAATYLGRDPNYSDLPFEEKDKLKLAFAFRVQDLLDKKEVKTLEEAYEKAFEEKEQIKEDRFSLTSWLTGLMSSKKSADEYIAEGK